MSEALNTDTEEFDLTDVPMDGDDDDGQAGREEREAGEEGDQPGRKGDAQAREPLPTDELTRRYENSRIALSEERRARRELERRLDALERGGSGGERRQERQQQEEDIDPETDPMGALRQLRAEVAAYKRAEALENESQAQRDERERSYRRIEADLQDHEAEFREEHPDYGDAAQHYAAARARELLSFGLTPEQVQPMLREEFMNLTSTAIAARKNPAAVVYELAKGRGFGQKGAVADPKDPKPGKGSGKLADIARGARSASPLQRAGGGGGKGLDASTVSGINIRSKEGRDAFSKAFDAIERAAKKAEQGG